MDVGVGMGVGMDGVWVWVCVHVWLALILTVCIPVCVASCPNPAGRPTVQGHPAPVHTRVPTGCERVHWHHRPVRLRHQRVQGHQHRRRHDVRPSPRGQRAGVRNCGTGGGAPLETRPSRGRHSPSPGVRRTRGYVAYSPAAHACGCALTLAAGAVAALFFVHDYCPGAKSLRELFLDAPGALLPESTLWSFVCQLVSMLRGVHSQGLACRCLTATHVLLTGHNRCVGGCACWCSSTGG